MTESKLIKTALYCHAYGASRRSIRNLLDTLAKRKPARWRARVAKQAPTLFNKREWLAAGLGWLR